MYDALSENNLRPPLKDLELNEIISSKDTAGDVDNISKYLKDILHCMKEKKEAKRDIYFEDNIYKRLKDLRITVSFAS